MQNSILPMVLLFSMACLVSAVIAWKATVAEAIGRLKGLPGNRRAFNRRLNLSTMVATAGAAFCVVLLIQNRQDSVASADELSKWFIGLVCALLVGSVIPFLSAKISWLVHEHLIGWPAPKELMEELWAQRRQSEDLLERICHGSENLKACELVQSERGEIRVKVENNEWVPLVGIYGTNAQSAFDRLKERCPLAVFKLVSE